MPVKTHIGWYWDITGAHRTFDSPITTVWQRKEARKNIWGTSHPRRKWDGSDSGIPDKPAKKRPRSGLNRKRKDKAAEDSDDQPYQAPANPSKKIKAAATAASAATAPAASVASADSAAPPKRVTRSATVAGIASLVGKPLGSAPKISRKHIEIPEPVRISGIPPPPKQESNPRPVPRKRVPK
ncbi:hypothetical protein LTR17_003271 [Elasticomyces elasticus]|nr:hypothetical protein LTR17_003271 [Elasticomyces elasticus]